ncbi:Bug family tripartite tricarboxylate transporter substrate binding protein [Roseomonas sp. BN140053]|uniref:Bug family tripartite tricarboxylate transporter substrate binding protein n=1 Tax=Roseomonas sp. BN140053 TaxID=3391898 RepID=UPI0039ED7978
MPSPPSPARTVRRRALLAAALPAAALPFAARPARAADGFPSRPISIVVPFAPGGGTDVLARLLAKHMGETWNQPVVVDNRAGAAGRLGVELVQRAAPDGHTLVMASTGALMATAGTTRPFAVREVLAPVTLAAAPAYLVVASPALGVTDLRGLLDAAKRNPGTIGFGSSGAGSASHLVGELFCSTAGVEMLHVPYRGTGQALNDLLAGRIGVMFAPPPTVAGAVADGSLHVLGLTSETRSPLFPGVPTVAEGGLPGYSAVGWFGLLAPRGTPAPVVEAIQAVAARGLQSPETRERLASLGAVPEPLSPTAFADYIDADVGKWQRLIRDRGITME